MNPESIPNELRQCPQWVCWRAVPKDNGKVDKIPVNAKTGKNASHNNPSTWANFEQTLTGYRDGNGNLAGIGYVFAKDDPFCGIDLDKCRDAETGSIQSWAWNVIQDLNSYTEISPSGTGVHIIVKGVLPEGGHKNQHIEIYDQLRFFTITGNLLNGSPKDPREAQDAIDRLLDTHFKKDLPEAIPQGKKIPLNIDDGGLLHKARSAKNGGTFDLLYSGQWEAAGYPSQSEADQALCNLLSFWWGGDPEHINRLFRQSGLMRPKWDKKHYSDGSTYGQKTIQNAVASTREAYKPARGRSPEEGEPVMDGPPPTGFLDDEPITEDPGPQKVLQHANNDTRFPSEIMSGVAGDFAGAYGPYLETPLEFLYISFLTVLGNLLSGRITIDSELRPQPRLYTVLLGESGTARKSTAISKTIEFFRKVLDDGISVCYGAGSPEGLATIFDDRSRVILFLDELKAFVQKSKIESSNLLPVVTTLFEENIYHNVTKKKKIEIYNAHLSLLAASTTETYSTMFTSAFLDIGFINRLFIVAGRGDKKFSIPKTVPASLVSEVGKQLQVVLQKASQLESENGNQTYLMPITPEAREIFDRWYFNVPATVFATRLDTYGHRLMPLLAINDLKRTIDAETMGKVIRLLDYELETRKVNDPIDADSQIAALEEKIKRVLSGGPLSKRDLTKKCHKERFGVWMWQKATNNLMGEQSIAWNRKLKKYQRVSDDS